MRPSDQPALGWTVVLRRQPVRVVEGRAEGGYTDVFELICCDCGDHPDVDYRDVSPGLRRIRGPYPLAAGVAAYDKHLKLNHEHAPESRIPGTRVLLRSGSLKQTEVTGTRGGETGPGDKPSWPSGVPV